MQGTVDASLPIVVLGGTGAVGRRVAQFLDDRGQQVVVGSRHLDAGRRVAADLRYGEAHAIDFTAPERCDVDPPGAMVNCTGLEDLGALTRWRRAGWRLIDISASSAYVSKVAALDRRGPPIVAGVGLLPGLTSLVARELVARDTRTKSVAISCLLGLGEDYGEASRDWTYSQLGQTVEEDHSSFRNFSSPEPIAFPAGFGRRPAWRFDFADRVLLAQALGVDVTTRYCFDSRLAGRALAVASAIPRLATLLRRLNRIGRRSIGNTAWWAGVIETDTGGRATATGNGQSRGTAAVAALAADRLAVPNVDPTARNLWDLVDLATAQTELAQAGVLVDVEDRRPT